MASDCADVAIGGDATIEIPWLDRLHGESRQAFVRHVSRLRKDIAQAQRDSVHQVIPIMLAEGKTVPELRAMLGRATWRKIHHDSESTNLLRALIRLRFEEQVSWAGLVEVPTHHLRSCRNAFDWSTAAFASQHAPAGHFHKFAMLYRDVVKMGVTPRPHWTPARLKRERDQLFSAAKIAEADPAPFAKTRQWTVGDYAFTQLCSDRALVTEGIAMRHCVASYTDAARADESRVFRCEGPERATLRFDRDGGFELRGYANADVSPACFEAAVLLHAQIFSPAAVG